MGKCSFALFLSGCSLSVEMQTSLVQDIITPFEIDVYYYSAEHLDLKDDVLGLEKCLCVEKKENFNSYELDEIDALKRRVSDICRYHFDFNINVENSIPFILKAARLSKDIKRFFKCLERKGKVESEGAYFKHKDSYDYIIYISENVNRKDINQVNQLLSQLQSDTNLDRTIFVPCEKTSTALVCNQLIFFDIMLSQFYDYFSCVHESHTGKNDEIFSLDYQWHCIMQRHGYRIRALQHKCTFEPYLDKNLLKVNPKIDRKQTEEDTNKVLVKPISKHIFRERISRRDAMDLIIILSISIIAFALVGYFMAKKR